LVRCSPPGQLNRYAAPLLKGWQTRYVRFVVEVATIARDETRLRLYNAGTRSRPLHRVEWFGALHLGAA
jgi:hypothetical protein